MDTGRIWINAAFVCQNYLREMGGVLSFIRVIDTISVAHDPEDLYIEDGVRKLRESKALSPQFDFVIMAIREGDIRSVPFEAIMTGPTGTTSTVIADTMEFNELQFRAIVIARLTLTIETEGLVWITIQSNGEVISRVPFRIEFKETAVDNPIQESSHLES